MPERRNCTNIGGDARCGESRGAAVAAPRRGQPAAAARRARRPMAAPRHGRPGRGRVREVDAARARRCGPTPSNREASTCGTPAPRATSTATVLGGRCSKSSACAVRSPTRSTQIADAVAAESPIDVCIVLDDAHEARPGSSGGDLIDRLVASLPDNGHLVLAARHAPAVAAVAPSCRRPARRDHAGRACCSPPTRRRRWRSGSGANRRLRSHWAVGRRSCASPSRWRPEVAIDFAQEEVLSNITDAQRRALFALSNLGYADRDACRSRHRRSTSTSTSLAGAVPARLAHRGRPVPRPRPLDRGAAARPAVRRDRRAPLPSGRGAAVASGDLARAGIARDRARRRRFARSRSRWRSYGASRRPPHRHGAAVEGPPASARARMRPRHNSCGPRSARRSTSPTAASTRMPTPPRQASATEATPTVRSWRWSSARSARTCAATSRDCSSSSSEPEAIPGSREHPTIDVALRAIAAIGAEMSGDVDEALQQLRGAPLDRVAAPIRATVIRLVVHCLLLSGRADEAVEVTQQLLTSPATGPRDTWPRSPGGCRATLMTCWRWVTVRSTFQPSRHATSSCAEPSWRRCWRRPVEATTSTVSSTARRRPTGRLMPRDAVLDAVARALCAVVDHDESHRGAVHRRRHDRSRRQPDPRPAPAAIPGARLRARPRGPPPVGGGARWVRPTTRTRAVSRWLVDLRVGRPAEPSDLDPADVFTVLPAAVVGRTGRPVARRPPPGRRAAGRVAGEPGPRTGARRAAPPRRRPGTPSGGRPPTCSATCRRCRRGGSRSRSSVRSPWPFDGVRGHRARAAPTPRSGRLLALLVVHGTLTRDVAIELVCGPSTTPPVVRATYGSP